MSCQWLPVGQTDDFVPNGGGCVLVGDAQIAIFNFNQNEWYAVQNQCPHQQRMVLSRGLIGDAGCEPKVACPLHKSAFSLRTGESLGGNEAYRLVTYPVRVEEGTVYVGV
ncbi:MAG: nitrite reductase small subunit NirD [Chloroflexi bacterium]|nr:nitrite reductase small subunit NirD [Chloroflexota bacterium]